MKLIVILTAVLLQVQAAGLSQTVSFTGENVSLEKIFAVVKKQTGYLFFYDPAMLQNARPVTIKADNLPLEVFIDKILQDQPLNYAIENKTIFITGKPATGAPVTHVVTPKPEPITGVVRDSLGRPVAEVTVTVRGTNRTVRTDAAGRFTIDAEPGQVLVFSHINLQVRTVQLRNTDELMVNMEARISELNEVAVTVSTGYKQMPKSQITGAASVIDQKVYDQRVAVTGNFLESLEGKIPGLVYNSQSGDLSIRGVSTFDAVKKPLIVVDGFPTEIDINTINPNDIISVSVLRDAAAASVYGVRASNGVIVVETKRGKTGMPVFSFRATYATQPRPDFSYLKLTDAAEYARIQYTSLRDVENIPRFIFELLQWPISPIQSVVFDVKENIITDEQAAAKIAAIGAYDNLKDYERLFYRNRQARQLDFDVSGGNDRSSYLLGINYVNELPVERESNNSRILINIANTYKLNRVMKFDFRGTYTNANNSEGTVPSYNTVLPWERLVDENGKALPTQLSPYISYIGGINEANNELVQTYGLYDHRYFPYAELRANTYTTKRDAMRFQGRLNTVLTKWLNFDLGGAFESENTLESNLLTDEHYELRTLINTKALKDPSAGKALFTDIPQGDVLRRTSVRGWNYTVRGQFNFNYLAPNQLHDISGIAGIEQRRQKSAGYLSSVFGYDGQSLVSKPVNLATLGSGGSPAFAELGFQSDPFNVSDYFNDEYSDRRFMSYYAEGTYLYDQRFIATGSIRLDQSNLFGTAPQYRNKPFWSVGAGWRLNKEAFLQGISWLNDLKLRASYGFNGNVPSSDNGPFLLLESGIYSRPLSAQLYNDVLSPENQSIRWESTTNYNLGIDYAFFANRLSGTIDYYQKLAKDVFGNFSSDPTTGFNAYKANTASIVNKGVEIGLNSVNIQQRTFSWRTGLTASFNNNKVTEVMKSDNSSTYSLINITSVQKGEPIDVYGIDSVKEMEFYAAMEKSRDKDDSITRAQMETLAQARFVKKLPDAARTSLDSMVMNGWELNDSALFRYSGAYRQLVKMKLGNMMEKEAKQPNYDMTQYLVTWQQMLDKTLVKGYAYDWLSYENMMNALTRDADTATVTQLCKKYMASAKTSPEKQKVSEFYKNATTYVNNKPAPDFSYKDINGKTVTLKQLRGKYVYIDVWATWCGLCKGEIPYLVKLEEALHGKKIHFVSISVDKQKDKGAWEKYVKDKNLKGIQLMVDKDFDSGFIRKLNVYSIPRFTLIDPNGKIVDANAMRPSDKKLKDQLETLL